MTLKALAAVALCVTLQTLLWLEGAALIEGALGRVERPPLLTAVLIAALTLIEMLVLQLFGTTEHGATRSDAERHVGEAERAADDLFAQRDDLRSAAGLALNDEPARRYAVYRIGFWRALRFFVMAAVFALAAAGLSAKALLELGGHFL